MRITVSGSSERYAIHTFSRDLPTDDVPVLDVAVVWDGPAARTPATSPRRSLALSLALVVRSLLGLRPPRAARPPFEPRPLPDGWNGAVDHGGPREVLHSTRRRLVRVAGREYPLPDDDATLVLLVRDDGMAEPVVRARRLTPAIRVDEPPFGARPGLLARLFGDPWRTDPWRAALMRDPEIAAVLDPRRRRAS